MQRSPFIIASFVVLGPVALSLHLALDPDPFSGGAASLLSAGILIYAVVLATGLLLSRGLWTTRVATWFLISQLALGTVVDLGPWAIVAIVAELAALAGLSGPWLSGWIRQRPSPDGPGTLVVALLLGTLGLLPGLALADPSGPEWEHLLLAGTAIVFAAGYARSMVAALWLLRLGLVPLAIPAIVASPTWGGIYLTLHVLVLGGLAWTKEAALAATPLIERVYGARASRPRTRREQERT